MARGEIGEVRAREANLRRGQEEVLRELAASGMPEEVWFRHGDEGIPLMVGDSGPPSLRRALWEAVEKSADASPVQEVEALSRRIEFRRNRSPVERAAPAIGGVVAAAPPLAGLLAFHWYLDPTWIGTATIGAMSGVMFAVLFGLALRAMEWLVGEEQDAGGAPATPHRGVEAHARDSATRGMRGGTKGGDGYHAATNPALSGAFDGGSDRGGGDQSGGPSSGGSSGGYDGGGSFSGGGDSGGGAL